jgi:hypothetical protein
MQLGVKEVALPKLGADKAAGKDAGEDRCADKAAGKDAGEDRCADPAAGKDAGEDCCDLLSASDTALTTGGVQRILSTPCVFYQCLLSL